MIHNDGDVLMTLTIAGLVDTDVDKIVQPFRWVGFYVLPGSGDTSADSLPVDPQVFGNSTAVQVPGHPCSRQVLAEVIGYSRLYFFVSYTLREPDDLFNCNLW